jgi:hypothetical protein
MFILTGCAGTNTVNYSPSEVYLTKVEEPELTGNTNVELFRYADMCKIRLNECNIKLDAIKKESQKTRN